MEIEVLEQFDDVDFYTIKGFDMQMEDIEVNLDKKHGTIQVVRNMFEDNPKAVMLIGYEVIDGKVQDGHIAVCDLINLENAENGEWSMNK